MSGRSALMIAVAGNGMVVCLSWAWYGWNMVGVQVAARNTARFSALWFMAGFAAPGLVRWIRGWPAEAPLGYGRSSPPTWCTTRPSWRDWPSTRRNFCTIPSPPRWRLRAGFCWCWGGVDREGAGVRALWLPPSFPAVCHLSCLLGRPTERPVQAISPAGSRARAGADFAADQRHEI
jgi:hypothetical protein